MVIYEKSKYYSEELQGDRQLGLSPFLVRALRARGAVTPEDISKFLNPSADDLHDPFLLPDMDRAVARIELALSKNERICVFGDYDVDGICATAMLMHYFRSKHSNACYHIPSRHEEGYGMTKAAVEKLHADGVQLIITVDNGISAIDEIRCCREYGIDVIVTDHHIPPKEIPECEAVVCHTVKDSRYPNNTLCGAGVAFKLLQALAGTDEAMKAVSLAGLATVADVVSLTDENRIFVKLGLDALNDDRCCAGFHRLLESIPNIKKPYTACNLGFAVAPRLNASGRMSDASLAVELFLSNDIEHMDRIISELNRLNELRQQEEADILNSAIAMLRTRTLSDSHVILLKSKSWNPGVIGIAASRLAEMYHRPTILFSESNGVLKGSARSIDGINIHDALTAVSKHFERFGGHAKAAGVTMNVENFDAFSYDLEKYLKNTYSNEAFIPRKSYEFDIDLSEISYGLVKSISMLAPFGEGNPSLVFRASNVQISHLRRFGNDAQHMRMDVKTNASQYIEAVYFASAVNFDRLLNAASVEMLFTPNINNWNGISTLQLRLISVNAEIPVDINAYVDEGIPHFCSGLIENCTYPLTEPKFNRITPIGIDVKKLSMDNLSGLLILVFTPDGAKRIIEDISTNNIKNIELCYSRIPDSPVFSNAVLIAPLIKELPRSGYDKVIFYDAAPIAGIYGSVSSLISEANCYINADVSGNSKQIAMNFDCSRDFLVFCYKGVQNILSARCCSCEGLITKLSNELQIPRYVSEFAIEIFFQLDFIIYNSNGTICMAPEIKCRKLSESPLYEQIKSMKG